MEDRVSHARRAAGVTGIEREGKHDRTSREVVERGVGRA